MVTNIACRIIIIIKISHIIETELTLLYFILIYIYIVHLLLDRHE